MRSLVLEAPGQIALREVPIPEPGPGELLIRVRAATTCGTDLKAFRRGHPQIPMPGPFGHEYSGEVVAVGEGAKLQPGDAIMGVHSAPCQHCFWCRRDQENLCESIMATKVLGSYAEYLLIPARIANLNVFAKPANLSFGEASLLEPLSCVAQGLLSAKPPETALIIGPGAIGLMFVAALLAQNARVTLAGRNPARLAVGEFLGAEITSLDDIKLPDQRGFDLVIECTGQVPIWERSVEYARRGGEVILFGGPPGGTRASFDTHRLHYDQITLLSPFHFGTKAVRQAHDWLKSGLHLAPLLTGERPLEDGRAIFDDLEAGRGIKYVVTP
jgi:L-iditol 2-dehydrogenase